MIEAMSDIGSIDSPHDANSTEKRAVQISEAPNSKDHLEALFNVLSNSQDQHKGSQGLWSDQQRKLPDSFFSPSKEKTLRIPGPSISVGPSAGQHNRSASMPASFPDPHKSFSLDSAVQGPIPPGWEIARTPDGLSYFIE